MKWFGLTGGIASGKSTVAAMLVERGVALIDADVVAREVVEPGQPALAQIRERFGDAVIGPDGRLDREALGAIVFEADDARAALNAIVHPAIAQESARRMTVLREAGTPFVVYDAALIVENQLHRAMDGLVVVDVPRATQMDRLMARDGLSEAQAAARIDAQIDPARRRDAATWLIDNSGALSHTEAQVERVLEAMNALAEGDSR